MQPQTVRQVQCNAQLRVKTIHVCTRVLLLQHDKALCSTLAPCLQGINWFGFNNGSTMLDGLWGQDALSKDFATVVHRLKLLGFNSVRLPFSFQDLHSLPARDWGSQWQSPADSEMAKSVMPPGRQLTAKHKLPALPSPPVRCQPSTCNDYLPSSSTYERFCWVVHFLTHNGFYVLIDNHLREDQTSIKDSNRCDLLSLLV